MDPVYTIARAGSSSEVFPASWVSVAPQFLSSEAEFHSEDRPLPEGLRMLSGIRIFLDRAYIDLLEVSNRWRQAPLVRGRPTRGRICNPMRLRGNANSKLDAGEQS